MIANVQIALTLPSAITSVELAHSPLAPIVSTAAATQLVKGAGPIADRYGITIAPYDCTMLMSYVLDGGQFEHTIENLVRRSFEHDLAPLKEAEKVEYLRALRGAVQ